MYCQTSPKATITYSFNQGGSKTFFTENTPIDIKVTEKFTPEFTGGQCPIFYTVSYRYKLGAVDVEQFSSIQLQGSIQGSGMIGVFPEDAGYNLYNSEQTTGSFEARLLIYHNNTASQVSGSSGGFANQPGFIPLRRDYYIFITSVIPINNVPDDCGNAKKICELQVINNGRTIFLDQGSCPCTFSVQCGDCPEGTTKCLSAGYPGYCCLPCNEVEAEIKAISSQIRRLNNG